MNMNTPILEKLSFGFEVEGMFKDGMMKNLNGKGRFVSDGSVSINPDFEAQLIPEDFNCSYCFRNSNNIIVEYCSAHHAIYRREGRPSTEYESSIYTDLDKCLNDLKKFTPTTHVWNETCGLHFHIGNKQALKINPKTGQLKNNKLFGLVSNLQYLKELIEASLTWCACQKSRMENTNRRTRYYQMYPDSRNLIQSARGRSEKYRVVRFHLEYNTLEFRFLSPCEHKVQNVINLLNHLTTYLGRNESIHRETEITLEAEPIILNLIKNFSPNKPMDKIMKLYSTPTRPSLEAVYLAERGCERYNSRIGGF